jgi:hypothetical protein
MAISAGSASSPLLFTKEITVLLGKAELPDCTQKIQCHGTESSSGAQWGVTAAVNV